MNCKLLLFIVLSLTVSHPIAEPIEKVEVRSNDIEYRLYDLEHKVKIIDSNQLNYKIEKDLLKETFSNNYQTINVLITLILGIIAILGYLGIRDIGKIKDKYESELTELKKIKAQFDMKADKIDSHSTKIDEELKSIIKENQKQSNQIKFIEIKEKIQSFFNEGKNTAALEYTNAALTISSTDSYCLNKKGTILVRLNQLPDAITVFEKSIEANPDDNTSKFNYAEALYFSGLIGEAKSFIEASPKIFENKEEGGLLEFFKVIELYHESDLEGLKNIAADYVQYDNMNNKNIRLGSWQMKDALYFSHYLEDNDLKTAFRDIVFFLDGQITGKDLLTRFELQLPQAPTGE